MASLLAACAGRQTGPGESSVDTASLNASAAAPEVAVPASSIRMIPIPGTYLVFEMVWVPEGAFWIGRTEVTWDEFLVYCDFDGLFEQGDSWPDGVDAVSRPSKPLEVAPPDRHWGYGRQPAVGMSWNGAKQYCRWLSGLTGLEFRLPTEDEWRLACGDAVATAETAWSVDTSGGQAREVAGLETNALGLHDMLGNLWEYCANPWSPDEPRRAVLRGGSWRDGADRVTADARLRFDNDWTLEDPTFPPGQWWVPDGDHLGMRIVLDAPGP